MSQERTRFPIQPKERRRSAKSGKDTQRAPEGLPPKSNRAQGKQDQDKPDRPPHRRHEEAGGDRGGSSPPEDRGDRGGSSPPEDRGDRGGSSPPGE